MGHPRGAAGCPIEEGQFSLGRPIDELVDEDDVAGSDVLLERSARRRGDHVGTTLFVKGVYVGSVVDLGWGETMGPSMSVYIRTAFTSAVHTPIHVLS